MYTEFVRNLLLQSEASGKLKRLGDLEARQRDQEEDMRWLKNKGEGTREGGEGR